MIARHRMAYDKRYGVWTPVIAYDIGRPPVTAIPIAQHPAVIEDMAEGPTESLGRLPTGAPKGKRNPGGKKAVIIEYLRRVGIAEANAIGRATGIGKNYVREMLRENPHLFELDHYETGSREVIKRYFWKLRKEAE